MALHILTQPFEQETGQGLETEWRRDGLLLLRRFYSPNQVRRLNTVADRSRWPAAGGPGRLNDLYLESEEIQRVALSYRLCDVLSRILDGEPLLCRARTIHRDGPGPGGSDPKHDGGAYPEAIAEPAALAGCWIALDGSGSGDVLIRDLLRQGARRPHTEAGGARRFMVACYSRRREYWHHFWRVRRRHENGCYYRHGSR